MKKTILLPNHVSLIFRLRMEILWIGYWKAFRTFTKRESCLLYTSELLQGHSNEECARILREVVAECQVCIKNCEEGVFENMLK